jgi:hypothetical protein
MELKFLNFKGEERLLGSFNSEKECLQAVNKFLEDHNYKSYYTRSWVQDGVTWLDVGSWSEFFLIYPD